MTKSQYDNTLEINEPNVRKCAEIKLQENKYINPDKRKIIIISNKALEGEVNAQTY